MWKCPSCGREFANAEQSHFCGNTDTVDAYIAAQPAEVQPRLQAVRAAIRAAAPEATEKMAWQMPTYWQGENLVHFAAFKHHLGFYPGGEVTGVFAERLSGYQVSKGSIRFPHAQPMDLTLVSDIVYWRVAQVQRGRTSAAVAAPRPRFPLPDFVAAALEQEGLWEQYRARPPYQQNDYVAWISRGQREVTRQKRLGQMLAELRAGQGYMGQAYTPKE